MRKFLKLFFIITITVLSVQFCYAQDNKVLVLPDDINFSSTNYLVYPDASIIFASDTVNELKKNGRIETVSMTEVRDALRKNTKLCILTKNALKEYKYNYNIPFVDFKEIAHYFSTNKVLIISSQTDVQSYFMRRTVWDFLNIPGAAVIDPAYKVSTYAALIDVDKEFVIWQNTYYKNIASLENRMIANSFAPATEQLQKLKLYSSYYLAPTIALRAVTEIVGPPLAQPGNTNSKDNIINVSDFRTNKNIQIDDDFEDEFELKTKPVIPKKTGVKSYGESVNDL